MKHISENGDYCAGELDAYSPLTHYATEPPTPLPKPLERVRCRECGALFFADGLSDWRLHAA